MRLVKPANDSYLRERIIESSIKDGSDELSLPHYALSHLWGISEENPHLWHDIGDYVDDEHGQPAAAISMRPEKRDTLFKLLEYHRGSYWWIDVLCARTDTPLEIMGDIYKYCRTCYAMLDCNSLIISLQSLNIRGQFLITMTVNEFWRAVDILDTLARSAWWKRVWTWQEMILPRQVLLIAETEELIYNTVDVDLLGDFVVRIWRPKEIKHGDGFKTSSRRCTKPEDYVYGVLGVFQFELPRGIKHNELWQLFISKVENASKHCQWIQVSPHAREFDLLTAQDMAHVFQALLGYEPKNRDYLLDALRMVQKAISGAQL
ncbi:hypothetical protein LRAMOSA03105 [Lichtheimia ramosa]|uniref:Heterokaryon incompatibility domain-containing protein n=1 Tax=Lichtheimia ramosa TaxID=688394 RepID=A0A077WT44_9FUNG|nr:hypothetical protein LRAMOSA03105 [Lichtheimia ramosa]